MDVERIEQREGEVIYWTKDSSSNVRYGIVFIGEQSRTTDEIVEGLGLGQDLIGKVIDEMEKEKKDDV